MATKGNARIVLVNTTFLQKQLQTLLVFAGYSGSGLKPDTGEEIPSFDAAIRSHLPIWGEITGMDHHFGPTLTIKGKNHEVQIVIPWHQIGAIFAIGDDTPAVVGFVLAKP
ncbi:MAG: hypothetical protein NTW28_00815 [Candidatus Solibacter sp.]|nr:hypothetical protein [Candidatus Solibacter sp.]